MKFTLLMRLAGPMQSWGLQSRFSVRDTAREPTKSGVLGLTCAALGRPRSAPINDLSGLRMGVRVLREGQPRRDYQTALDIVKASATIRPGKPISESQKKDTEPSHRHYLADAWFLVGLEGENRALLEAIDRALAAPRWSLCLGRKAFPPGLPVRLVDTEGVPLGLVETPLVPALMSCEDPLWRGSTATRYILEDRGAPLAPPLTAVARKMQPDQPLSFRPRRFVPREVVVAHHYPQD